MSNICGKHNLPIRSTGECIVCTQEKLNLRPGPTELYAPEGAIVLSHYWQEQYTVISHNEDGGVTVRWHGKVDSLGLDRFPGGRYTTHRTPLDQFDKIVSETGYYQGQYLCLDAQDQHLCDHYNGRAGLDAENDHNVAMEREHELVRQNGGLQRCPNCDQFTVKVTVTPTRNYGGGSDTYEECQNEDCDYADVAV